MYGWMDMRVYVDACHSLGRKLSILGVKRGRIFSQNRNTFKTKNLNYA
jgi:hypothetical protein